jgi:hypothetical protein
VIDNYLTHLERELRALRAPRRRFLAEAEDHLRTSADELGDELEAVQRFGDAATVATRFAQAAAESSARRSTVLVVVSCAVYAAAAVAFRATAGPEFADFPQGAPSQVALFTAVAAAVVGLVSKTHGVHALVASSAALTGGAGLEIAAALTRPAGILPWQDLPLATALFSVAAVAATAATVSAAIARRRAPARA